MVLRQAPALLLAFALLAGCSDDDEAGLRGIYGADAQRFADILPEGTEVPDEVDDVLLIKGAHLEGRIGNGTWGTNLTAAFAGALTGPSMTAPDPAGGGGDVMQLEGSTLAGEVRVKEWERLAEYQVGWVTGAFDATQEVDIQMRAADEPYQVDLGFGVTQVQAVLYEGTGGNASIPAAIFAEPLQFRTSIQYTITGFVQPVSAQGAGGSPLPWPTPRDEMVDRYEVQLPAGVEVSLATSHNGGMTDGTDVDLGLYRPDGTGLACHAAPASAPSAADATEQLTVTTDVAGLWSVQVGAMANGCPNHANDPPSAGAYLYVNSGPVPYTLTITA